MSRLIMKLLALLIRNNIKKGIKLNKTNYTNYYGKTKNLIVIIDEKPAWSVINNNIRNAYINFIGYYDFDTSKFYKGEGTINWEITEEAFKNGTYKNILKKESITKIKVLVPKTKTEDKKCFNNFHNNFTLQSVLEENVKNSRLEEYLNEYKKSIEIDDKILGRLTYDKSLKIFIGKYPYQDKEFELVIEEENKNKEKLDKAIINAKKFLSDLSNWDKKMKEFSSTKLLELAKKWHEDLEIDEEEPKKITKTEFKKRMFFETIVIREDGTFECYYDDGDLFFGHVIVVTGNINSGIKEATMEG